MNPEYFSVGATKVFHTSDGDGMFTREQLQEKRRKAERCGECPYPDDCHVDACPYDIIDSEDGTVDKLMLLHARGDTDSSIGKRLRMRPETVAALRITLGLEENVKVRRKVFLPEVPKEDPCMKCRSKEICKAHNGTCGDRARWEGSVGL